MRREKIGADVVAASFLEGAVVIVLAALARAGRQFDVWGALEVSPFTFIHSNKQRCEIDRKFFAMEASRPKCCREPFRGEFSGNWGQRRL